MNNHEITAMEVVTLHSSGAVEIHVHTLVVHVRIIYSKYIIKHIEILPVSSKSFLRSKSLEKYFRRSFGSMTDITL
jgi:hypothetical protein